MINMLELDIWSLQIEVELPVGVGLATVWRLDKCNVSWTITEIITNAEVC